jgi:hypothetical protein
MDSLIVKKREESKEDFDFRGNLLSDANKLALFLRVKEVYTKGISEGMPKGEYSEIFNYKILADKKNLKSLNALVSKTTFLFPRVHSCLPLLLNEIS